MVVFSVNFPDTLKQEEHKNKSTFLNFSLSKALR